MKKYLLLLSLCCFVLAATIISCKKYADRSAAQKPDVSLVRAWFVNEINTYYKSPQNSQFLSGQATEKLLWDKAIQYTIGNDTAYQIPLAKKGNGYAFRQPGTTFNQLSDLKNNQSFTYLVVTQRKTGTTCAVMSVVPDANYLQKAGYTITGNRYRDFKPDFKGYVLFHTWDDHLITSWRYDQGKVTKRGHRSGSNSYAKAAGTGCTQYLVEHWCQNCSVRWKGDIPEYYNCQPPYVCESWTNEFCADGETPGGGGSGPGPGDYDFPYYSVFPVGPLCGANQFAFKQTGNAWTGQVNFAIANYRHQQTNQIINVKFPQICVTIPMKNGTVSPYDASEYFRASFNRAYEEVLDALNAGYIKPVAAIVTSEYKKVVGNILQGYVGGSSISTGPCQGGIPQTECKYMEQCF